MSPAAHTLLGLSTSPQAAWPPCCTQGAWPLPTNSRNATELSPAGGQQRCLLLQLRGSRRPPHGSCPGCTLCGSSRHRGRTSSSRSTCLCPLQQGEALDPLHGNDGAQRSPVQQRSTLQPQRQALCPPATTSLAALGQTPALPHPLGLGAKRRAAPALRAQTQQPRASSAPGWGTASAGCTRGRAEPALPPLKPRPLCSPRIAPRAGGVAPRPFSAPCSTAAGAGPGARDGQGCTLHAWLGAGSMRIPGQAPSGKR